MSEALHYRSLSAVAADIASGALSSEEVTRQTLAAGAAYEAAAGSVAEHPAL